MPSISEMPNTQAISDRLTAVLHRHRIPRPQWGEILHPLENMGWNWAAFEQALADSPLTYDPEADTFTYAGKDAAGDIRALIQAYADSTA